MEEIAQRKNSERKEGMFYMRKLIVYNLKFYDLWLCYLFVWIIKYLFYIDSNEIPNNFSESVAIIEELEFLVCCNFICVS